MPPDKLLPLIDAIYAAAADPSQWPSVAQQIQHVIGGHSVNLGVEDLANPSFNFLYTNGPTDSDMEFYGQNCIGQDQFLGLLDRIKPGDALLTQDVWDEKQLHSHFPYEDFYEGLGYDYHNAGTLYRDAYRRGWFSVIRSLSDPVFSIDDLLLMKAVIPHLRRALMINMQLLQAQQMSQIALDSLEHIQAGTILLSSSGYVVQHNQQAASYIHRVSKHSKEITLRLPDPTANRQLKDLISSIAHNLECHIDGVIPFVDKGTSKTALCFPWHNSEDQSDWLRQSACCIIFILSPSTDAPPADLLQITFGLSNAEVAVLQRLLEGSSVAEIAAMMFVTEATVRFHIRNLLNKTQSRNQAELISRVFNTIDVRLI